MNKTNSTRHSSAQTFLRGMARVADMFGGVNRASVKKTYYHNDSQALRNDWHTTGSDISTALKRYEQKAAKITKR